MNFFFDYRVLCELGFLQIQGRANVLFKDIKIIISENQMVYCKPKVLSLLINVTRLLCYGIINFSQWRITFQRVALMICRYRLIPLNSDQVQSVKHTNLQFGATIPLLSKLLILYLLLIIMPFNYYDILLKLPYRLY